MDVIKAKNILLGYAGKQEICDIFMRKEGISLTELNSLWNSYVEFMVIKTLGNDVGSHNNMIYSASPLIDELWHCHVLCTLKYKEFMELVNKINPLVDFIHHSLELSLDSEAEKMKRRQATSIAYK